MFYSISKKFKEVEIMDRFGGMTISFKDIEKIHKEIVKINAQTEVDSDE